MLITIIADFGQLIILTGFQKDNRILQLTIKRASTLRVLEKMFVFTQMKHFQQDGQVVKSHRVATSFTGFLVVRLIYIAISKTKVYATKPNNLKELRQRIIHEIHLITNKFIHNAVSAFYYLMEYCLQEGRQVDVEYMVFGFWSYGFMGFKFIID